MFIDFIFRLRKHGLPVGVSETLTLAQAMVAGLHDNSLDGFYFLARSVLVHHEGHLDAFDQAFAEEFRGAVEVPIEVDEELRAWLAAAGAEAFERAPGDWAGGPDGQGLDQVDIDELLRAFEQRRREQTERHDGGDHWIGTGGSSPFGQGGQAAGGLSTGGSGGGRSAVNIADARHYRAYRSDVALDIRQFEVALRRLRSFVREGAHQELDIDRTIDETARNAGDIEIVTRPPSRPDTHVILMIDVGGSMFPYSQLISQLFSAAKKATHFKDLRTYYFHNCAYGKVFETDRFTEPVWVPDLLRACGGHYKLIMVGDALMADYELMSRTPMTVGSGATVSGLEWLAMLHRHFDRSIWLNPEPASRWRGTTIEAIGGVFEMFPMTVDGITDGMALLNRGSRSLR